MDTQASRSTISATNFEKELHGQSIRLFRLSNANGLEVYITNFGQKIVAINAPDRDGNFEDVVLGFSSIDEYIDTHEIYFGAVIGRYGNRIANGKLTIDGTEYTLEINNSPNHLHGGTNGYHNLIWDAEVLSESEIQFTRVSKHMEEGYPGNVSLRVHYELTDSNELKINYYGTTDQTTVLNMTHHSYFNLRGAGNGTINDHVLWINADRYTPVNKDLIPTGELAEVANTPFDFRTPKPIGTAVNTKHEQLLIGKGYDHNFVLNNTDQTLIAAAKVVEPDSGRVLEVFTTEPGMQLYGGNFLDGTIGKEGKAYTHQGAFCLETQHYPDSPNQSHFPSTLVTPDQTYRSTCIYKFSTEA